MDIGVIIAGIDEATLACQPWILHKQSLAEAGIHLHLYRDAAEGFQRPFDAMLLQVWQDWGNKTYFKPWRIVPIMEQYAIYRSRYPSTVQIVLNHVEMGRRPYATPYWRTGDPVLYRTPAYDRSELYPFPAETIWAYELVWGKPRYVSDGPPKHRAGFVGTTSGPLGYRQRVAAATAKVGIGICAQERPMPKPEHDQTMADCRIIVCPRGWGEQSVRHWEAWLSGKPVLTDRECDSVEMIPGVRLRDGVHYLVFDDPEDIPDIVSDWTGRSRADDLDEIAENGRRAALSYDAFERIKTFFGTIANGERLRASLKPR